MGNPSKNKGKRVERGVCDLLNSVFNLPFQRVPNSGAFFGGKNVTRLANASATQIMLGSGDIIPPEEMPNLLVESKARKDIPFHLLIKEKENKDLSDWIDQVEVDYNAKGKIGFYFITILPNRKGFYICYNKKFIAEGLKAVKNHMIYVHNNTEYVLHELSNIWLEENKMWMLQKCSKSST